MAHMTWSDDLAVGNYFIDNDHQTLIGLINEFHDAMAQGKGSEVLRVTLGNLIKYMAAHFKREEAEMDRIGYSDATAHRNEHEKLVREVLDLQKRFNEGNALLTVKVSKFLKDWLVNHIMETDKAFGVGIRQASTGG
jgi:hemerythrin-like metal-binding protein